MGLESRNIFIDTESFVKMGLNFNHPSLQAFCKLCKNNKLSHLTTSVVQREVKSKIKASLRDGLNSLHGFRRKARLLEKIEDERIKALFAEIDEEEVCEKALNVYADFLKDSKSNVLSANNVDPETILSLYFEKKAPFGDGKKKAEFPDAISLSSLLNHLGEEKAYVISNDSDLKRFCVENKQLISIGSLDRFLDLYNEHESALTELVKKHISNITPNVKERIKKYISEAEAYNEAPWEGSDVEYFSATEVYDFEPLVVWVDEEECLVTFDVDVDYEYTVSGPNLNDGLYYGRMAYTFDAIRHTDATSGTFTIELGFCYKLDEGQLKNIEESSFHVSGLSDGIAVYVEEPY